MYYGQRENILAHYFWNFYFDGQILIFKLFNFKGILYSYLKTCSECRLTHSSSVCRVWFLSFIVSGFRTDSVNFCCVLITRNTCLLCFPWPACVLMKEGWEVLSREGLAGCMFFWVFRFPFFLAVSIIQDPLWILWTKLYTHGFISVCLRRRKGPVWLP